jgi:predicted CXXCH cytochrome family protein
MRIRPGTAAAVIGTVACVGVIALGGRPTWAKPAGGNKPAAARGAVAKPVNTEAPGAPAPKLADADCAKCHAKPPADIQSHGGKHRDLGCQDCHAGHPPSVKKPIPACSQCHDGKPHYKTAGCLGCHRNPHTPLKINLPKNLTTPCMGCHTAQGEQFTKFKSRHSSRACTFCHEEHRKVPQCVKCHKPHGAGMTQADCGKCHKAHMPKAVTYAGDTPAALCGSCHTRPMALLGASTTKHHDVTCAQCHPSKHKAVAACSGCHKDKHPASIMARFPVCGTCHRTAHSLNNWAQKATPQKAVRKRH